MLPSSLLLLAALLAPVQDSLAVPEQDPPVQEPAVAAEQAPQETAGAVLEYLESCQSHLYDAQAAGLHSLAFSLPVRQPNPVSGDIMELGTVGVSWAKDAEPDISVTVSDSLPPELAQMAPMLQAQLQGQGQQVLGYVKNNMFMSLLEGYVASLDGSEDGLVKVHFEPKADATDGRPPIDWFFDEDEKPVKFALKIEQGPMSVDVSFLSSWRAASETDESLLLDTLSIVQDMGFMKTESDISFLYADHGGLQILTGYTERTTAPGQSVPMTNEVRFADVVVNGETL